MLKSYKENNFSCILFYGPLNSEKIYSIKSLSREFFGKVEKIQTLFTNLDGKLKNNELNKKIDDFQLNHFYSKQLTKIIILENFDSLGNLCQMNMREKMDQTFKNIKFWILSKFFSKINQTILSRCIKIYFNYVYSNVKLIRSVEIFNKENTSVFIENLQFLLSFNKNITQNSILNLCFCPPVDKVYFNKTHDFHHENLKKILFIENLIKEEKIVLFKKLKFYSFCNSFVLNEFFKSSKKEFYHSIPLIEL